MDWGTHVVLATKLLSACGLDKGAAIYSVIPVIDTKPAHYHRVYAHILENQPDFLDIALEIFSSTLIPKRDFTAIKKDAENKISLLTSEINDLSSSSSPRKRKLEKKTYAYKRISEETEIFLKYTEEASELVNDSSVSKISHDKLSAAISLLSHTYFDTWNNPVQVFLPQSSFCSAQWKFWDRIDYMQFRGEFYQQENIIPFRKQIIQSPVWRIKLKPEAVIKSLIIRLGEMGQPAIPYEIIDLGIRDFMRYMNINDYQRADRELKFFCDLEKEIENIILEKYRKK